MRSLQPALLAVRRLLREGRSDEAGVAIEELAAEWTDAESVGWLDLLRSSVTAWTGAREDIERALSLAGRVRAAADAAEMRHLLVDALLCEVDFLLRLGRPAGVPARLDRAIALAAREGQPGLEARAVFLRASHAAMVGDALHATGDHTRAAHLARSAGESVIEALALRWLATRRHREGDVAAARELAEQAITAARSAGVARVEHDTTRLLARCALAEGRVEEARSLLDGVIGFARADASPWLLQRALNERGEASRRLRDWDAAEADWREASTYKLPGDGAIGAHVNLAWLDVERGRHRAAITALTALEGRVPPNALRSLAGPLATTMLAPLAALGELAELDQRLVQVERYSESGNTDDHLALALARALTLSEGPGNESAASDPGHGARQARIAVAAARLARDRSTGGVQARIDTTLDGLAARGVPVPLGSVDVDAVIGRGGMGAVWGGVDRDTGAQVAVKVLLPEGDPEAFQAEVRVVARLVHPAVVPVLATGTIDAHVSRISGGRMPAGADFLVMERADRGPLTPWCGRLEWAAIARILDNVLAALGRSHAHGLVHCDVKPANVLLAGPTAEDGAPQTVWLADFGIARVLGLSSRGPTGTPEYMAPEQFTRTRLTPATDLYALGCLAAALVQGAAPFGTGEPSTLARSHRFEPPPPLAPACAVPPDLEGWVRRLLAKAPDDRFGSAAHAREALAGLAAPGLAPAPTLLSPELGGATFDLDAPLPPDVLTPPMRDPEVDTRMLPVPPRWPDNAHERGHGLSMVALREARMTGRLEARDHLWRALIAVATAGTPGRLRIVGPAGSGRSRLLAWLSRTVREHGLARATSLPVLGSRDSAEVVRDLALSALALPPAADQRATAAALGRRIGFARGRVVAAWLASPDHDMTVALQPLLEALTAAGPAIIAVDDVHLRPGLVSLLHAATQVSVPVLIVETAVSAHGLDPVPTVTLPPLTPEETGELLDSLLPLDRPLRDAMIRTAAGIPQVAVQLAEDLVARGALVRRRSLVALRPGARLDWPDSLHAVWLRRIERLEDGLPPEARTALVLAALLAPEVDDGAWAKASKAPPDLREALRSRLVRAGLALPTAAGWRFTHAGLPESLRRWAVDAGVAPALHLACSDAVDDDAPSRGIHLLAAGEVTAAAPLLEAAVRYALHLGDGHEAAHLIERWRAALDASGAPLHSTDRLRADLLEFSAHLTIGGTDDAAGAARMLLVRAETVGGRLHARAHQLMGRVATQEGRFDDARDAYAQAL
ncbi:MAG: tetratricopeptide (TPR) repeat protein, partial [Myxococcota bacterium]